MYGRIDANSQEIARLQGEHAEVWRLINRRQKVNGHPYGRVACILGGTTIFVWGAILRDTRAAGDTASNRAYSAWLVIASIMAIATVAAAVLWASVCNQRRVAAEGDRIAEYRHRQLIRQVSEQVLAGIHEQQQAERRQKWERWMSGTGTDTRADPRAEPPSDLWSGGVIPFDRTRGTRNSG